MISWVIGLFVAALAMAVFGFSSVAPVFAATARVIFFILLILFLVSSVVAMVGSRAPAVHSTIRTAALVVLVAALSIGTYAWIENGMSAERLGRVVDRQTASIASETQSALRKAGDRTEAFVSRSIEDIRSDAKTASNEASQKQSNTSRE